MVVGRQGGKGCPPVAGHQAIGPLQSGHLKDALEQGHGQDFGSAEAGACVRRHCATAGWAWKKSSTKQEITVIWSSMVSSMGRRPLMAVEASRLTQFYTLPLD